MLNANRITLYRSGALGDTLLTVSALRALRARYPHASMRFIGDRDAGRLLHDAGLADTVISASNPALSALSTGTVTDPDAFRRALGDPDVAIIYTTSAAPATAALERAGIRHLVTSPFAPPGVHVAVHLVAALTPLGVHAPVGSDSLADPLYSALLHLGPPANHRHDAPVILHPGAGAAWKRWPADRYRQLAGRISAAGNSVVLLEGPAEAGITAAMGWPGSVIRDLSLPDLVLQLMSARAYVGNDSGVTHLAALVGVPTVAIFGPTHPDTWRPLGPRVQVVRHCSAPAADRIRICDDPGCLAAVEITSVVAALARAVCG